MLPFLIFYSSKTLHVACLPLVKLSVVLWSPGWMVLEGSEGCSHHISVGTAVEEQQRGEE